MCTSPAQLDERASHTGPAPLTCSLSQTYAVADGLARLFCLRRRVGGVNTVQRQTFGELVRRYRRRSGLTQEELAERAELSPRGLIYLERNERHPQPGTARRL